MYQYGQGVKPDDAKAVAWYRLAADQGNVHGRNNLEAFKDELKERGGGFWESANEPVSDAAIEMVHRRARIRDLRAQITGLETDALAQENSADELANMGNNGKNKNKKKNDAIAKLMDAVGTVVSVKPLLDAAKSREQAARLREELARLEDLDQSSANVPVP
jgi:TPR repeat protein